MSSIRTWRIIAAVRFPIAVMGDKPPEPPQSLKFVSRIPQKMTTELNGGSVTLGPWLGTPLPLERLLGPPAEVAALTLLRLADTPEQALAEADDLLERILDDLSFQLQEAVRILQLEVIDITPPLSVGMTREILIYPFPMGYTSPKFLQSVSLGNVNTALIPSLRSEYGIGEEKTRAALRWYIKALAAPYEADRFAFNWIALEILCSQSDIVVEKPYAPKCEHEITHCPVCSTPTSRVIKGPTIKKFLTEKIGIDPQQAKELWNMRQMFHGANHLSQKATKELPRLVNILRHAALIALKDALAISRHDNPVSSPEAVGINQSFALGGTREITEDVLQY
jgi:hypothetical protein